MVDQPLSFARRAHFVGAVVEVLAQNQIAFTRSDLELAATLRDASADRPLPMLTS